MIVKELTKSVKKAKFLKHEEVSDWLNSWGTEKILEPPK